MKRRQRDESKAVEDERKRKNGRKEIKGKREIESAANSREGPVSAVLRMSLLN